MHCRNAKRGGVCVGGPVFGGGRGARGVGGRVEPERDDGGGRGAVGCAGKAARQTAIVLQLLLAGTPRWVDGWVAGGGGWRARVCKCGCGCVRVCVGRLMGVVGCAGKVVQELQAANVQIEMCVGCRRLVGLSPAARGPCALCVTLLLLRRKDLVGPAGIFTPKSPQLKTPPACHLRR